MQIKSLLNILHSLSFYRNYVEDIHSL